MPSRVLRGGVALGRSDAAFCVEKEVARAEKDKQKEKAPGRIHVISPMTGAKLRPPFVPPFASNHKGEGQINGLAVMHGALWLSSNFGFLMALPRDPSAGKPGDPKKGDTSARAKPPPAEIS